MRNKPKGKPNSKRPDPSSTKKGSSGQFAPTPANPTPQHKKMAGA